MKFNEFFLQSQSPWLSEAVLNVQVQRVLYAVVGALFFLFPNPLSFYSVAAYVCQTPSVRVVIWVKSFPLVYLKMSEE